jgi:signal peptidase
MKRAIGLVFMVAACVVAFLAVRGNLPFIPIFGSSMEPVLQSGGLLMVEPMEPQDVRVGDIIVYNIPSAVREFYNYPPVVAHRVIKVITTPSLSFRTAGDNTGEDPFTIRPQDIKGTVGKQIPYLGLPLLFFQSTQGLIFAIIALALLAIFLYGGEIGRGGSWLHRGIFSPVINEEKRTNRLISRRIEATEKKMDNTEQALEKFSLAVAEYAKHLASHTSAIQGLSEASQELKKGAVEQNRVLSAIMESVANVNTRQQPRIIVKEAMPPITTPPAEVKARKTNRPAQMARPAIKADAYHKALAKEIPGCARKHPAYPKESRD